MLRTSLLEQNHEAGVRIQVSEATIEATVIRNTQPNSDGIYGRGIDVTEAPSGERATLTLRRSLIEQNHDIGVIVVGSDATIEATVVRNTQPRSDGRGGRGISIQSTNERAKAMLRSSLVEQNHDVGVIVFGSDATIETTVVHNTQPESAERAGQGIVIHDDPDTHERAKVTLRSSLVEQNHDFGVAVWGSDATIEATVVRDTQQLSDGAFGDGIAVISLGAPTTAAITSTKIEANARAGISNFSSAVILVSSTVECNKFDLDGEEVGNDQPFTFDGSKGNLCGCETLDRTCPVLSANLRPPEPIAPIQP
jgi:hypothetical protein